MDTSPEAMLSKEATQRAADGDFDAAIALLRKSFAIGWQLVPNRARVARFLQQSGRYRESLEEFALIINEIPPNLIKWAPHLVLRVRIALCAHQFAEVCDQARISCTREKDSRRAAEFKAMRHRWSDFAMRAQGRDQDQLASRDEHARRSLELFPTDEVMLAEELALLRDTERAFHDA